ncbi:MAG: glycosyltransferase family 39 protein, partial [Propionivibrio sp.]
RADYSGKLLAGKTRQNCHYRGTNDCRHPFTGTFMRNLIPRLGWSEKLTVIVLCAAAVSLSALASIPIEAHEAFVLLAAQHMRESGDWVIPYFNGEPHLTKPPLNYWLTLIISWLSGSERILPWHGRLPSALAGVALVWLTGQAGKILFDARVGLLAAAIAASCSGFFYYTHTARPEMFYAFLCALTIVAYLRVRENADGHAVAAYAMWATFGLATLCKGPQLPLMLLLAFAIDQYWLGRGIKQGWRTLRPVSGLLLMALIALPWWWLLDHRLGGAGLRGTQLSGTLLHVNPLAHLSLYYLYRPLQLLLPWIIFLPALAAIKRAGVGRGNMKLLVLLVVLPAIVLTFGPQKRWYYMLPSLLPMVIILAACIVAWAEKKTPRVTAMLSGLFAVMVLAFVVAGFVPRVWGAGRFSHAELAEVMKQHGSATVPQATWGITPEVFAFYSRRTVTPVDSAEEIVRLVDAAPQHRILLLLDSELQAKLPPELEIETLGKAIGDADDAPAVLVIAGRP